MTQNKFFRNKGVVIPSIPSITNWPSDSQESTMMYVEEEYNIVLDAGKNGLVRLIRPHETLHMAYIDMNATQNVSDNIFTSFKNAVDALGTSNVHFIFQTGDVSTDSLSDTTVEFKNCIFQSYTSTNTIHFAIDSVESCNFENCFLANITINLRDNQDQSDSSALSISHSQLFNVYFTNVGASGYVNMACTITHSLGNNIQFGEAFHTISIGYSYLHEITVTRADVVGFGDATTVTAIENGISASLLQLQDNANVTIGTFFRRTSRISANIPYDTFIALSNSFSGNLTIDTVQMYEDPSDITASSFIIVEGSSSFIPVNGEVHIRLLEDDYISSPSLSSSFTILLSTQSHHPIKVFEIASFGSSFFTNFRPTPSSTPPKLFGDLRECKKCVLGPLEPYVDIDGSGNKSFSSFLPRIDDTGVLYCDSLNVRVITPSGGGYSSAITVGADSIYGSARLGTLGINIDNVSNSSQIVTYELTAASAIIDALKVTDGSGGGTYASGNSSGFLFNTRELEIKRVTNYVTTTDKHANFIKLGAISDSHNININAEVFELVLTTNCNRTLVHAHKTYRLTLEGNDNTVLFNPIAETVDSADTGTGNKLINYQTM